MTIEKSISGSTVEWKLSGWLDTQSAQELETALNELPPDITALVFDCPGLEYISSAGLRLLVAAHKKMNGALTVRHLPDEVMDVIKLTRLDERLNFE